LTNPCSVKSPLGQSLRNPLCHCRISLSETETDHFRYSSDDGSFIRRRINHPTADQSTDNGSFTSFIQHRTIFVIHPTTDHFRPSSDSSICSTYDKSSVSRNKLFSQFRCSFPGANPTIVSYNATNSLISFMETNVSSMYFKTIFYNIKGSVVSSYKFSSLSIGSWVWNFTTTYLLFKTSTLCLVTLPFIPGAKPMDNYNASVAVG
jgi:hypothetical protein